MRNNDLGTIKRSMTAADLFIDDAQRSAKKSGDSDGEERLRKLSEHVKEVKRSFDNL